MNNYINLKTDFGFKKLFSGKEVLIPFLNAVLNPAVEVEDVVSTVMIRETRSAPSSLTTTTTSTTQQNKRQRTKPDSESYQVDDLFFDQQEEQGATSSDKCIRYDIVCTARDGRVFNVELQRAPQKHYFKRALFYWARMSGRHSDSYRGEDSLPHEEPVSRKRWNFNFRPTFHIGVLESSLETMAEVKGRACFKDCWLLWANAWFDGSRCRSFSDSVPCPSEPASDRFNLIFLSLNQFYELAPESPASDLEKFCWILENSNSVTALPSWCTGNTVFKKALDRVRKANLKVSEMDAYQKEVLDAWTEQDKFNTQFELGYKEGLAIAVVGVYASLKEVGVVEEDVIRGLMKKFPQFSIEEIHAIIA